MKHINEVSKDVYDELDNAASVIRDAATSALETVYKRYKAAYPNGAEWTRDRSGARWIKDDRYSYEHGELLSVFITELAKKMKTLSTEDLKVTTRLLNNDAQTVSGSYQPVAKSAWSRMNALVHNVSLTPEIFIDLPRLYSLRQIYWYIFSKDHDDEFDPDSIIDELDDNIYETYMHEYQHRMQYSKNPEDPKPYNVAKLKDPMSKRKVSYNLYSNEPGMHKHYLSANIEIDAWSTGIVSNIIKKSKKASKPEQYIDMILKDISTNNGIHIPSIEMYKANFRNEHKSVWNYFLKQIYVKLKEYQIQQKPTDRPVLNKQKEAAKLISDYYKSIPDKLNFIDGTAYKTSGYKALLDKLYAIGYKDKNLNRWVQNLLAKQTEK